MLFILLWFTYIVRKQSISAAVSKMKKIFILLVSFYFLSQTYNLVYPCTIIYRPPLIFDSTEYIFIGKVINYTEPLFSDSLGRSFQGLIVEIVEPVYLPKNTSGFIKIVPYVLGAACDLTTWDRKSFELQYPLGTELRIVGKESVFIKNKNPSNSIILDVNSRNMFHLSKNFKEPAILFSTKSSIFDYRYACIDSNKSFSNKLTLYDSKESENLHLSFQEQYHFELRKDLYRLSIARSDLDKMQIIKRLFAFSLYSKKDFLEIINRNIKTETIKQELVSLMPKRFERPSPDTTLHSEIPASLSSPWLQTNGPYGGSITSLVLKNSDKSVTLFAGTRTNGVFRSTDIGENWIAINSGLTNPYIYTVFTDGNYIYAGTDSGAFRSTNNGENWIAVNNGFGIKKVFRVYAFTFSEKYLFAGSNHSGVFRSSDNGESWSEVNSGLSNLQVNCLLTYDKYLFAGTYGGVFVSTDDGNNWRTINEGLPNRLYPNSKSLWLYINTILMSGDRLFIGTEEDGMYSSKDFGETWTPVNIDLKQVRVYSIIGNPSNLIVSTRNGIFRSTNNGETWIALDKTFSRFTYTTIALHDSILYTGDNGVHYTSDYGEKWININEGLRNTAVNDLSLSAENLIAKVYTQGIFLSTDNGIKWSLISDNLQVNEFSSIACDEKNIIVGTNDEIFLSSDRGENWQLILKNKGVRKVFLIGNNLFAYVNNDLMRSTNLGKNWDTCLTRVIVKSIEKSGDFLFLVSDGKKGTLRSTDNGLNWESLNIGEDCRIYSLKSRAGKLYASAVKCGIMISSDNGETWLSYDNDFKYFGFNNLTAYGEYIFATSEKLGVFISMNDGKDWIPFNFGLADLWVLSLTVKDNILFAGTTTGVWAHKLNN